MPTNKAFRYNIMMESYKGKLISRKETRKYLIDVLGLNVPETPDSIQEQQEIGIFNNDIMQKPTQENIPNEMNNEYVNQDNAIPGINANGNVALSQVQRGGI